jgi:hypothetical protein
MDSVKYIGMDCDCGAEWCRKDRDGMRHRDQSQHDSAIYRWAALRLRPAESCRNASDTSGTL